MKEGGSAFKILTGKPTGKRPLGSPMRIWQGNLRMDLKEIFIHTRNWVDLTQDRDYWRALLNAALVVGISCLLVITFQFPLKNLVFFPFTLLGLNLIFC